MMILFAINIAILINCTYMNLILFKVSKKLVFLLSGGSVAIHIIKLLLACKSDVVPQVGVITLCIMLGTLVNYIYTIFIKINKKEINSAH